MSPRSVSVILLGNLAIATAALSAAAQPAAPAAAHYRSVLDKYCVACHNHAAADRRSQSRRYERGRPLDREGRRGLGKGRAQAETRRDAAGRPAAARQRQPAAPSPRGSRPRSTRGRRLGRIPGARPPIAEPRRIRERDPRPARRSRSTCAALLPADDLGYGFDNIADVLGRVAGAARALPVGGAQDQPAGGRRPDDAAGRRRSTTSPQVLRAGRPHERGSAVRLARRRWPSGTTFRSTASTVCDQLQRDSATIRGREPSEIDVRLDGVQAASTFAVGGPQGPTEADAGADGEFAVARRPARASACRSKRHARRRGVVPERSAGLAAASQRHRRRELGVRRADRASTSVEIGGPFDATGAGDTPSRRAIFICRPATRATRRRAREQILRDARAPRLSPAGRPTTTSQPLLEFYATGARATARFEARHRVRRSSGCSSSPSSCSASSAIPPAPAAGRVYRLSDLELASRLSFFLWSSIPTTSCSRLAEQGQLQEPAVLEQQVAADAGRSARSTALVENFAGSGCTCATCATRRAGSRRSSRSSTTTCARRCGRRPSCSSRASSARIAASSSC